MGAHELLGLELRLLVGVVEALPDVQVALVEPAGVRAGDKGGRNLRVALEPAQLLRAAGEREHPARPRDIDRPGFLEREAERHRCGAVDDHRRLGRQQVPAPPVEPEVGRREVAGERGDAVGVAAGILAEQVREHAVDPLARGLFAVGAHDREHRPFGPLQVPGE